MSEDRQREIERTLNELQRQLELDPDAVVLVVPGPTRYDSIADVDVPSALGVVVASSFLEEGAGKWLRVQEFNTPENLFYAERKDVGLPGLKRTIHLGQAIYLGNDAVKLVVTLDREREATAEQQAFCEATMNAVAFEGKPANVPQRYTAYQIDPEDVMRVEQFLDECCMRIPDAKVASGPWSNAYNIWAIERGYPPFGGGRNYALHRILEHVYAGRGLGAATLHAGNTNHVLTMVPHGVRHRTMRKASTGRESLLPRADTVDGVIYEVLSECSPNEMVTKDIVTVVRDRMPCAETSVRQGCSRLRNVGVIAKGRQGYYVPMLDESS